MAALAANGIPYAYLAFEGEGHGFRGAVAIRRTLEARLSFLGQVFGFEPGRSDRAARGARARRLARTPVTAPRRPPAEASTAADGAQPDRARPRPARRRRRARLRRPPDRRGLPDPPACSAGSCSAPPRAARRSSSTRPGLPAPAAADPVRGRLLDADPRLQGQSAPDRAAGGRPRAVHHAGRGAGRPAPSCRSCCPRRAFALGAIVAPPDAVAATAIFRRLGVPRRVVTILEGESLVNDATALIALPVRGRGGDGGAVLGRRRPGPGVRVRRPRRDPRRRHRRVHPDRGLAADDRPDAGDHGLAARAVRGLPAGRGPRRERGPGGGGRRADRRPARRPGPVARGAADGPGRLGHRHVHRSTASRSC